MKIDEEMITRATYKDPKKWNRELSGIYVTTLSGHDVFVTDDGTFFTEVAGGMFKAQSLSTLANRIEGMLSSDIHGVKDTKVVFMQGDGEGTHILEGVLTGRVRQRSKSPYYEIEVGKDHFIHIQSSKIYRADSVDVKVVKRLHAAKVAAEGKFDEAWGRRRPLFTRHGRWA